MTRRARTHRSQARADVAPRVAPASWQALGALGAGVALAFGLGLVSGRALEPAPELADAPSGAARVAPSAARVAPREPVAIRAPRARGRAGLRGGGADRRRAPVADSECDAFDEQLLTARELVARGPAATLAALRSGDRDALAWISGELVEAPANLCAPELIEGLRALAADPSLEEGRRVLALELLSSSPAADAGAVETLGELAGRDADRGLRGVALDALCALAASREDLRAPLRAALLAGAEGAGDAAQRATALGTVTSHGASASELEAIARHLDDGDAGVRAAAAAALADSDASGRARVLAALERTLEREADADAARAALATALQVARGDADAVLARLASAPAVLNHRDLQQQVLDYRRALGAGETDPVRILRARADLVHHRSMQRDHAE
ncbi:MAG: hypothetical protein R3F62_11650 [Planctomycetota bacterium]